MSLISIDLGNKRCGIAIELEGIPFVHSIVPRTSLINELKKIFKEKSITKIIVGLPYDLYGIKNAQLDKTRSFINKLKSIFPDKEIIGIDERFTSFEADNVLQSLGNKDNKGKKDAISALLILETYINQIKKDF
ncbi:Holliday junction resolvase RuvX [Candidatus Gracilibacteria bacterium]|nr:MAG: Holliday junction resolvase RuvX [Candidatus Gracilibacteria bacterium]